jgi:membrane-associated phospholipid phosphatase
MIGWSGAVFLKKAVCCLLLIGVCLANREALAAEAGDETAPGLWRREDTVLTGVLLASVAAVSLLDEDIRNEWQEHRSSTADEAAKGLDVLGSPLTGLGIGGGLYVWGQIRRDAPLTETGTLAVQSVLVAEVAAAALKAATGRQRPGPGAQADHFRPFALETGHDSFPSGHAVSAFALASTFSRRAFASWAPYLYYGLATLVGVARSYDDDHWLSDVVAGALVGELSARLAARVRERGGWSFAVRPAAGGGLLAATHAW